MKNLLLLAALVPFILQAQECTVYHDTNKEGQVTLYAENTSVMPYSVKVEGKIKGMKATGSLPLERVIPGKTKEVLLTLTPRPNTSYSYGYHSTFIEGDVTATHDNDFVYQLPYKKGLSFRVDQGYNGTMTHQNKNALDFHMDEGTEICAIRGGLVVKVTEDHKRGCPDRSCAEFNNYINVLHSDGSIADYSHLKKDGALVSVGDPVEAGQVIGLSGSTGVASGPHLHIEVDIMSWNGQKSVPAKYQLENGAGIPEEGKFYLNR